jgi:signal transduction histidine kinase
LHSNGKPAFPYIPFVPGRSCPIRKPMSIVSVVQVGPQDLFPHNLREAVQAAFPGSEWRETEHFPDTPQQPPTGNGDSGGGTETPERGAGRCGDGEMMVLFSAGSPGAAGIVEALDACQLPRWAAVCFGNERDALPVDGWSVETLAWALGSTAARHIAARENARLRGDLMTMARRVSHDLRTPLGGVIATVDMLAEIVPDGMSAVRPLFSSVDELTKIINRTSYLLRAIAQPLPKKPVAMGTVVQEASMRLERIITQRQASISRPAAWPQVQGVESWLEVIWWNLLHNAVLHGGPVPVIELDWLPEPEAKSHRFRVRDHGPGVAAAAQGALFRPFHLLHDPNAPRGFGLSIVRTLVEMQGGRCGYSPRREGGAEFYFTLPDG